MFVYFYSATLSQHAYVFSGCSTNMLEKVWVQVDSEKVTECQTEARRSKSQVVIPLAGTKEGCIQVSVVGKPAATYVLPRVRKPQANSRQQDDGSLCLWGCTIFYSIRYFTLRHFSKHHCRTRVQNPATTTIHINQTQKESIAVLAAKWKNPLKILTHNQLFLLRKTTAEIKQKTNNM